MFIIYLLLCNLILFYFGFSFIYKKTSFYPILALADCYSQFPHVFGWSCSSPSLVLWLNLLPRNRLRYATGPHFVTHRLWAVFFLPFLLFDHHQVWYKICELASCHLLITKSALQSVSCPLRAIWLHQVSGIYWELLSIIIVCFHSYFVFCATVVSCLLRSVAHHQVCLTVCELSSSCNLIITKSGTLWTSFLYHCM